MKVGQPPKSWFYRDEFTERRFWRGDNARYYALLPGTNPLLIVNGQDVAELDSETD
jgi:hypothetical protein